MTSATAVFALLLAILAFGACVLLVLVAFALLLKLVRHFVPDEQRRRPARDPAVPRAIVPAAPRPHARPSRRDPRPPARREPVDPLVHWRYQQLLALGLDPGAAVEASRAGVDTSGVRSLVERGCRPRVALAILQPDQPPRARPGDEPA